MNLPRLPDEQVLPRARRALNILCIYFGVPKPALATGPKRGGSAQWTDSTWGLFSPPGPGRPNGTIYLTKPNDAVERVVAHEFTHYLDFLSGEGETHTPEFYARVDQIEALL